MNEEIYWKITEFEKVLKLNKESGYNWKVTRNEDKDIEIKIKLMQESQEFGFDLGIREAIEDEIEFINYILVGDDYTKEYYIKMLKTRLNKLVDQQTKGDKER